MCGAHALGLESITARGGIKRTTSICAHPLHGGNGGESYHGRRHEGASGITAAIAAAAAATGPSNI